MWRTVLGTGREVESLGQPHLYPSGLLEVMDELYEPGPGGEDHWLRYYNVVHGSGDARRMDLRIAGEEGGSGQ